MSVALACVADAPEPRYAVGASIEQNPLSDILRVNVVNEGDIPYLTFNDVGLKGDLYVVVDAKESTPPSKSALYGDYGPINIPFPSNYVPKLLIDASPGGYDKDVYVFNAGWTPITSSGHTDRVPLWTIVDQQYSAPLSIDSRNLVLSNQLTAPQARQYQIHVAYEGQRYEITGYLTYSTSNVPSYSASTAPRPCGDFPSIGYLGPYSVERQALELITYAYRAVPPFSWLLALVSIVVLLFVAILLTDQRQNINKRVKK